MTARAVLHHVADADAAIRNLVASLAPGGAILLIEPDFLPVSVAEPPEVRAFWDGWLAWSRDQGIDYHVGRALAPRLASLGLVEVAGTPAAAANRGSPHQWISACTSSQQHRINDERSSRPRQPAAGADPDREAARRSSVSAAEDHAPGPMPSASTWRRCMGSSSRNMDAESRAHPSRW